MQLVFIIQCDQSVYAICVACGSYFYCSEVNCTGGDSWHSETDECVRYNSSVSGNRSPARLTNLRFCFSGVIQIFLLACFSH